MLAGELRRTSLDTIICYLPYGSQAQIPAEYAQYGAVSGLFCDEEDSVVIAPEIYPMLLLPLRSRHRYLWWLSLSNYYNSKQDAYIRDALRYVRLKVSGSRPWSIQGLKAVRHLSQSNLVSQHLSGLGIPSSQLTDYVNPIFLDAYVEPAERNRDIIFNEKKSSRVVKILARELPQYRFIGLSGMSPSELRDVYRKSRLFVDFGTHPGKDRMPREAVSQGCTLITGTKGTAGNSLDLPISSYFKLDERNSSFVEEFRIVAGRCVDDYETTFSNNFRSFQTYTHSEREVFRRQLNWFLNEVFSARLKCEVSELGAS